MSNPSNVEFGWNETVGYTKNGDKYKLLYVKPTLSFQFKVLFYSTFGAETYEFIQMDGQVGTLTPEQMAEVNAYAIALSTDSGWDHIIPDEVLKGAYLSDSNLKFLQHGGGEFTIESQYITAPHVRIRKKTEVKATGPSYTMRGGQSYNVVDLLTVIGIDSGTLEPLFKQVGKVLKPYNTAADTHFKVVLLGSWVSTSGARSMELSVGTDTENRFIQNRASATTSDSFTFSSMIAVDVGGSAATNGVVLNMKPNGGDFLLNTVFVAITQMVLPSDVQLP